MWPDDDHPHHGRGRDPSIRYPPEFELKMAEWYTEQKQMRQQGYLFDVGLQRWVKKYHDRWECIPRQTGYIFDYQQRCWISVTEYFKDLTPQVTKPHTVHFPSEKKPSSDLTSFFQSSENEKKSG
jgi:hypothetical protein